MEGPTGGHPSTSHGGSHAESNDMEGMEGMSGVEYESRVEAREVRSSGSWYRADDMELDSDIENLEDEGETVLGSGRRK